MQRWCCSVGARQASSSLHRRPFKKHVRQARSRRHHWILAVRDWPAPLPPLSIAGLCGFAHTLNNHAYLETETPTCASTVLVMPTHTAMYLGAQLGSRPELVNHSLSPPYQAVLGHHAVDCGGGTAPRSRPTTLTPYVDPRTLNAFFACITPLNCPSKSMSCMVRSFDPTLRDACT